MLELTLTVGGIILFWMIVRMARNFNEHDRINALMKADGIDPERASYDVRRHYIYLANGEAPPETPENQAFISERQHPVSGYGFAYKKSRTSEEEATDTSHS